MHHPSFTELLFALSADKRKDVDNLLHSEELLSNLNELWPRFCDLADKDFVRSFAKDPVARAWEMQLGLALRRFDFKVEPKRPGPGPDFLTYDGEKRVWIEATVAGPGETEDRVPKASFISIVDAPEDKILLRITNALDRKARKLQEYIEKGIVREDDRYVIALCTNIPNQLITPYHAYRAVYALGGWECEIDAETNKIVSSHLGHEDEIRNSKGAPISTDGFLMPAWNRVSALLFSSEPFVCDMSLLGNDFSTYHNFSAQLPLRSGWLRFRGEYHIEDKDGVRYLSRSYGSTGVRIP